MSWQKVKLKEVINQIKDSVLIDNSKDYKLVTVSNKGVIKLREIVKGVEISANKAFVAKKGQFIYSRLSIHNGAFGIIPSELNGALVTSEMPLFEFKDIIIPDFFIYSLKNNLFKFQLEQLTKGVGRTRVKESSFLDLEIDLPSIEIQNLIVSKIKSHENEGENISNELTHQLDLIKQLRQAFLREAMQGKLVRSSEFGVGSETGHDLLAKIKAEKAQLIAEKKLKKEKELPPITADEIPFEIPEHWAWCRLGDYFSVEKGLVGIQKAIDGEFPLVVTGAQRLSHNEFHFEGKAVIIPTVSSTGHGHASLKRIHYQEGKFAVGNILACIMPLMPKYFNMKFIYNYLDTYKEFFFVEKMKGAANVSLKISSIKETPIPLIPIEFQNKYEYLMAFCDGLEESIKESQVYNEKLLQQVLREALQGDTVINE